ncbi:MAG TPA: ATPase domain-containing protein [Acidobacteriaceae bacterium]|nr:ATPase domain-containing protein [Acidobacteriaceae bacterium]
MGRDRNFQGCQACKLVRVLPPPPHVFRIASPSSHRDLHMTRISTGITGLDDILSGGLPSGQMYLLQGNPGTGKTTIAMQFMLAGVAAGETVLYITLSEPRTELNSSAESHGFNLGTVPVVEFVPDEAALQAENQYTVFHPSEVELASTIQRLTTEIEARNPDRLVIDSLSELRLLANDRMKYRRQLLALKQYFSERRTTVMLLDDCTADGNDLQLQSIAHGVISLDKKQRSFGSSRRQMEIVKLRGSAYREGYHDYTIRKGGVMIFPRLVAAEHGEDFPSEQVKSGIKAMDAVMGGGVDRGSSVLVTGPTGVGKSSIAMQYAVAAANRGERAVVYLFDEVLRSAKLRANGLGMPVKDLIENGKLQMRQVDPAELSPGEFVWQIRSDVNENDTRLIVIDSLNGFLNAMPGEQDLTLHVHELLSYLSQKGVITILVLNQMGLVGTMHTQVDVSYLADSVVLLRYYEMSGRIHQTISVLKKRIGGHERTLREISFSEAGISVGDPLTNFKGVLTGVPELLEAEIVSNDEAAGG